MAPAPSIQKITFLQWLKHPTTVIMMISVNAVWVLIWIIVNISGDRVDDWKTESARKDKRIEGLEKQLDEYTKTIMFKDGQVRNRDIVIDSLSNSR